MSTTDKKPWYNNIIFDTVGKAIMEFLLTFSNKAGLLSSKRIERFIFVVTVVSITWIASIHNIAKWTALDYTIILAPLLLAAGFNVIQGRKDTEPPKSKEEEHEVK